MRLPTVAVLVTLPFGATETAAQVLATRDSLCVSAAALRQLTDVRSCRGLAASAVGHLTESQYVRLDPRDLQNTNAGATASGSGAQDEAVPTVQPTAAGAASLSAVGADSGLASIATISLNPAMFFAPSGDAETMARLTRIADISLLVPVGEADKDQNGRPDYFGLRLRLNVNGAQAGTAVAEAAKAFLAQVQDEAALANRIASALGNASDPAACISALFNENPSPDVIRRECGVDFQPDERAYETMRQRIAVARAEADAKYFGLDLRADFGDPTLGGVDNASATSLSAGLAFGKQVNAAQANGASVGVRGRAGMRYTELRSTGEGSYAFDGGFGLEARRSLDATTSILLTAGLEARYGGDDTTENELQTNYTAFRATLSLPVTGATALAIAYGTPIAGKISPTFSVNFNWKLLLPKAGLP